MNQITVRLPSDVSPSADVSDLVHQWENHLRLQVDTGELAENTRNTYVRGWHKFSGWLSSQDVHQVDSDVIRRWMSELRQEHTPNTVNVWLSGVRAFFSWAVGARLLVFNPTEGVKSAKRNGTGKKHLRDVLTDAEVRRVLAQPDRSTTAGKRDYAILILKAYTAVRDVELHRADLSDLRTQNGRLVLFVRGKGRDTSDEYLVLANDDLEAAVYDWCAARGGKPGPLFTSLSNRTGGNRLSLRAIRAIVKGYYKSAGVHGDRKTSHSLRHTAITNAIRHGAPVQKVQSMARHQNVNTTLGYFHEVDRIDDPAEGYIAYDLKAR